MDKQNLKINRSFDVSDFTTLEGNVIEGHPIVFERKTNIGNYFYEIIERGAFDGCDMTDVAFFVNHGTDKIPLARSRRNNGNSTMQLITEDSGLLIRATLDIENNNESKSLYSAVNRGDIDGMSFSFLIKEERWENMTDKMPTRYITKFSKIFEVSAVNNPAYTSTDIYARSLESEQLTLENVRNKDINIYRKNIEIELEREKLRTKILINGGL